MLWTGNEIFEPGDNDSTTAAGLYDLGVSRWRIVFAEGIPCALGPRIGVWTGSNVLVWGGSGDQTASGIHDIVREHGFAP